MLHSWLSTSATALTGLALFSDLAAGAPSSYSRTTVWKRDDPLKFDFSSKVRGVNLGGWFVLEPWITPSLFSDWTDGNSVKDEWGFCQSLGSGEASKRLQAHWSSWITQSDFGQIAAAGMNHVRIPIGYWSIVPRDGEPFVGGAYEWLGKALDWANSAGLKVIIDLHGASGSQNGFDNSGRYGSVGWTQGDTIDHSIKVLNKIRDDHASHPAVSAIELLNEPMGPSLNMDTVRQFYMDGWGNLKDSNVGIMFHDAFKGVTSWNDWGSGMWNLILDTHHYEIFDDSAVGMSPSDHVKTACAFGSQMASNNKWTVAGEWTGAQTDCAKWLNGLGKGARYDGTLSGSTKHGSCDGKYTGTVAGLSNDDKNNLKSFIQAQLEGFEMGAGWIFWTWKTESAPEWDMQDLLKNGLFPNPVTSRLLPKQC